MLTIPKDTDPISFLMLSEAKFVLFGIPEDIGVRANFGRPGAASAWKSAIKSIANIQHNRFSKGNQIIILGTLDVSQEMNEVENLDNLSNYEISNNILENPPILRNVAHSINRRVNNNKTQAYSFSDANKEFTRKINYKNLFRK